MASIQDGSTVVRDQYGNLKYRYLYANGRPLRVDAMDVAGQPPAYFRYNARGDAAAFVDQNGSGVTGWQQYGTWGDMNGGGGAYYTWNAAWGYLTFPSSLWAVPGDALEGFYYAHGRWYVADTGLWLSPWDVGDYLYGGDGQDPTDIGWISAMDPWWCETATNAPTCQQLGYRPPKPTQLSATMPPSSTMTPIPVLKSRTPTMTATLPPAVSGTPEYELAKMMWLIPKQSARDLTALN